MSLANFSVDDTLGAAFIGFSFSCVAFGVSSNQAVTYFTRYPEDKIGYKLLVAAVWILSAIDQAFIGHVVYFYTITNYANPLILLEHVAWTLIVQLTLGAVIGTIVRLCFALRVWRFSQRNIFVTVLIVLLILAELGFQNPFLAVLPKLKLMASLALGAGALTDVVIAGALSFFLRQYRTGSRRADSLVTTLTVYAINTGAFTASVSILTLVFYDIRPDNFQFLAFFFILSKLYAISFFCTLNTRRSIRGKGTDRSDGRSDGFTVSLPGRSVGGNGSQLQVGPRTTRGTTGTFVYGYPTSGMGTSIGGPGSAIGSGHVGGSLRSPPLEAGEHHDVSVISDADESGSDVKARDQFEYGSPDSNKRYSQSPSSHHHDDKDDLELTRRGAASPTSSSAAGTAAHAYAYSPPTSPVYSHSLESGGGGGYGWGSAAERGRKGIYAYRYGGTKERDGESQGR
ncbi:hypothetical protein C8F01DRAFT_1164412 [Mycena amicta]|nr:hypothetical protein C8F01DRAFT_1164412 [Mycena amicta]